MDKITEYLDFAISMSLEAGKIMKKYFRSDKEENYKEDRTIVTKADKEINSYLIKEVKKRFPECSVDGEEERFIGGSLLWVCDPIDGTAMYARGIPVSVFSLALTENGESLLGVVYDPFTETMYCAKKGGGAFKNGKQIHVNNYSLYDMQSVANFDMWPGAEYNLYGAFEEIGKMTYAVGLGSVIHAAMCVASGDFTLALFPGTTHKNCDIAAAKVIVEEAGGKVTDLFGNEQRYDKSIKGAIISNGKIHDETVALLQKYIR
ncbi:MAG: inositol monophosphatase family protein [Eubacteriales bacterium]